MASEYRRLVFTHAEFEEALATSPNGRSIITLSGRIAKVRFGADGETLVLLVLSGAERTPAEVQIPTAHGAAALVWLCLSRRIPLPRSADKALTVVGDNVALELRFTTPLTER